MQQGYCAEANQQILYISRNIKLHYCAYKNPTLGLILSSIIPFHQLQPYFLQTTLIIYANLCTGLPGGLLESKLSLPCYILLSN